jgi:CubicO group peptidase (beta-lactamase class C family)
VRAIEGLPGVAMVTRAGAVEVAVAGGAADVRAGQECTLQTRFQIASVSKQFTATAAMMLAESGTITLDDPVERWLPGCPAHWRQVTLHHLLTHTAGIRHWDDTPGFDPAEPMNPAARLRLMLEAPLLAGPGTGWRYSSPGYVLAGHILERACGQPYAEFLADQIFVPLRLSSTTGGAVPAAAAIARGHRNGQPIGSWDLREMPGTGDICSTAGDVARFITAVHSGALLTSGSTRALCTAHTPAGDQGAGESSWITVEGYGYGHFVGTIGGRTAYFHPGDNPGYQSFSAWLPEQAICVVILVNDEAASIENLLKHVLQAGRR